MYVLSFYYFFDTFNCYFILKPKCINFNTFLLLFLILFFYSMFENFLLHLPIFLSNQERVSLIQFLYSRYTENINFYNRNLQVQLPETNLTSWMTNIPFPPALGSLRNLPQYQHINFYFSLYNVYRYDNDRMAKKYFTTNGGVMVFLRHALHHYVGTVSIYLYRQNDKTF